MIRAYILSWQLGCVFVEKALKTISTLPATASSQKTVCRNMVTHSAVKELEVSSVGEDQNWAKRSVSFRFPFIWWLELLK